MYKFTGILFLLSVFLFISVEKGYTNITEPGAIGAIGGGMASVVANPDDVIASFYYNPAGLARLEGTHISSGAEFAHIRTTYRNSNGYARTNHSTASLPMFGYSTDRLQPVVFGVGLFSTLGVGFNYKNDPAHGVFNDIKSSAGVLYVAPAVAYKVNSRLSLGLELNIGYGIAELDQPISLAGTYLGYLETETDGFGYGVTLGLLYDLSDTLTLGFSWRSAMRTSQHGEAKFMGAKSDVDLDLYWPHMVRMGIAYSPNSKFTFSVTAQWSDWSNFDRTKFSFEKFSAFDGNLFDDSRDTMKYQVGAEYWCNDQIVLRLGYQKDEHSIDSKYLSPLMCDADTHMTFSGIGLKHGKWKADVFFVYTVIVERRNSSSLVGYPNGKISGNAPVPSFQISYAY
jgi:long-chain fatty acid transport protein